MALLEVDFVSDGPTATAIKRDAENFAGRYADGEPVTVTVKAVHGPGGGNPLVRFRGSQRAIQLLQAEYESGSW